MAYNPNIPAPTNRVQDDIAAMRGNFQHLAPLAQLAPAAGELQAVSELAPYVQAILDSRIVEMGSNANGEYVRWENGLQICMVERLVLGFANGNHMFVRWTLPAAFVAADYVPLALYDFHDSDTHPYFVKSLQARSKTTTNVIIDLLSSDMFTSSDIRHVSALAIGRWT